MDVREEQAVGYLVQRQKTQSLLEEEVDNLMEALQDVQLEYIRYIIQAMERSATAEIQTFAVPTAADLLVAGAVAGMVVVEAYVTREEEADQATARTLVVSPLRKTSQV